MTTKTTKYEQSYFTRLNVPVIFVGHNPNYVAKHPFDGEVGKALRDSIKRIGLKSYGITDILKNCLGYQTNAQTKNLDKVNEDLLYEDLGTHHQMITVTLGSPALRFLNHDRNGGFEKHGRIIPVVWNGIRLWVMPMIHPVNFYYEWRQKAIWNEDFNKLEEVLK